MNTGLAGTYRHVRGKEEKKPKKADSEKGEKLNRKELKMWEGLQKFEDTCSVRFTSSTDCQNSTNACDIYIVWSPGKFSK